MLRIIPHSNRQAGKRIQRTAFLLVLLLVMAQFGIFATPNQGVLAETAVNRTGTINVNTKANIRSGPGTTYDIVDSLTNGHQVTVISSTTGTYVSGYGDTWYRISFIGTNGYSKEGYVVGGFVTLDPLPVEPDADFEALLAAENFPESYKAGLRVLHAQYPSWQFKALHTGLDWQTAVEEEHTPGYSLISNSVNDAWKSLDAEAYDWATNTWTVYDGSSWVMCSRDLIAYYMDPRNMMSDTNIFQFASLNYLPDVQSQAGVEVILKNSFMSNTSFTYIDPDTSTEKSMLYSEAFLKAAAFSNVSPYHLAARSLVEVGSKGSSSVTGLFSEALAAAGQPVTTEYDGYYNFYNIGATSSTEVLGNVRNGLEYAKLGSDRKPDLTETDQARLIPWNDRYRAIVGGSSIIGKSYINVGQNTLYLQKFDVDNSDGKLYWHLYMGSITAPQVEGGKLYKAYSETGDLQKPLVFILPVFLNMPESACAKPAATGNPNNWLSGLSVDSYDLTPGFDPAVTDEYSVIVENAVSSVQVSATPVSGKSTVTGAGTLQLAVGNNPVSLVVTAENGSQRIYKLNIVRKTGSGGEPTPTPTAAPTPTTAPTAAPTPTPAGEPPLSVQSSVYRINEDDISGINPADNQNEVGTFTSRISVSSGYNLQVANSNGTACTNLVGTGCKVNILYQNALKKSYTTLIYGDVNGDGRINSSDLNALFQQLLGTKKISSCYLTAADADHNGKVSSADLNTVFKHILQEQTISQ